MSGFGTPPKDALPRVDLMGMDVASCDESALLDVIFSALGRGEGGWLVTANLDFLRRYAKDPRMRGLYAEADLRVADGMPLVWAAWLLGTPLPSRIAGSSLIEPLARRACDEARRVYFLGGADDTAERAARLLQERHHGFQVAGHHSPWLPTEPDAETIRPTREALTAARPDIVLVALGSPKQEWVIRALRTAVPQAWFIGVGMSFSFVTGQVPRAPQWMQTFGLEWIHRLVQEPRRLGKRYLVHDAPFGLELLGRSVLQRARSHLGRTRSR